MLHIMGSWMVQGCIHGVLANYNFCFMVYNLDSVIFTGPMPGYTLFYSIVVASVCLSVMTLVHFEGF